MEIIKERGPFARYAAGRLVDELFSLVDVGCSGGIDEAWRLFGENLQAFGFDPNVQEINRLKREEKARHVSYEAAFIAGEGVLSRNPWSRLAVAKTIAITANRRRRLTSKEKTALNAWKETVLAEDTRIHLPTYFENKGINSIDFIKIDIDGADFEVLQSLSSTLKSARVIGLGLEVNFFGSHDAADNTFHNTDRFMCAQGFDLFGLTIRKYAMASLPHRYVYTIPAQSIEGRPLQGDALYLRDFGSPDLRAQAEHYGAEKLLKLAIVFSLAGLPDCAAEILTAFSAELVSTINIDHALDILVGETGLGHKALTYREVMDAFAQNSEIFYPDL